MSSGRTITCIEIRYQVIETWKLDDVILKKN